MNRPQLLARDIMTRRADTAQPTDKLRDAVETMVKLGLSVLPIVDRQDRCVGMLSKTDIVHLAGRLEHEPVKDIRRDLRGIFFGIGLEEIMDAFVEDVMVREVVSVDEGDSIAAVADKMLQHQIHHVPVCGPDDRVLGVVSSMDILKAIRDEMG